MRDVQSAGRGAHVVVGRDARCIKNIGAHSTVWVSIREFRISVRFVLYIALSKQQWRRWKIICPLRLAIVNDIVRY